MSVWPTGLPDPIGKEGPDQEPAEVLFYSALCMIALCVHQLATAKPKTAGT